MAEQYGVSKAEEAYLRQQAQVRGQKRAEYLKKLTDPYRHSNNHGEGYIFDPAFQRFHSLKAKQYDYFRPTPRTTKYGILMMLPMFIFGGAVYYDRKTKEDAIRSGKVAYRDRPFKLV